MVASLLQLAEDLPLEDSTDYPEISTEEPTEATEVVAERSENDEIQPLNEDHEMGSDAADNHDEEAAPESEGAEVRRKRAAAKEDEHKEHQHLDNPDEVDSSLLPVEHRGLDDEEEQEQAGNSSSGLSASGFWVLLSSSLLVFITCVQCRQSYA